MVAARGIREPALTKEAQGVWREDVCFPVRQRWLHHSEVKCAHLPTRVTSFPEYRSELGYAPSQGTWHVPSREILTTFLHGPAPAPIEAFHRACELEYARLAFRWD